LFLVFKEKGRDIEEGIEAAKILEEAGYDAFKEILKKILKVPVITAGRMENPELASVAIMQGKTDMIAMARPLLADAEIPNKIMVKTSIRWSLLNSTYY